MNTFSKHAIRVLSFAALAGVVSCSTPSNEEAPPSNNVEKLGSYVARYDPILGMEIFPASQEKEAPESHSQFALSYSDRTGASDNAIRDHSVANAGKVNYGMGLVDPDSCTADYNPTTHVLSFYAKLINKSNYLNDWTGVQANCNPATKVGCYEFTNLATFPRNTTYYTPFYYLITGLRWNFATYPQLITAVNTNLQGASCSAANGLTLTSCDTNSNNKFDSVWPDPLSNALTTYTGLPGWDFSPYVTGGTMAPGDNTGCVLFMQYTLTQNQPFDLFFDLLAVKSNGAAPPKPTVTTPATPSYKNTSTVNVTISNCANGRTMYVDGGSAQASFACTTTTGTATVTLRPNQVNNLSVYQIAGGLQSPSTTLVITHDDTRPTLVSWSPADGETVVGTVARCVATFSEPMKTSSFNAGLGTGTNTCSSGNFDMCISSGSRRVDGTISYSSDTTQAVYTPLVALNASLDHTCNVTSTLTDLALNTLDTAAAGAPPASITFTTGTSGQDLTAPYVKSIFPGDNTTVAPGTSFYVYFSEPVQAASLTAFDCDGAGTPIPNIAVWQTNQCPVPGAPARPAIVINGSISLNAEGNIATFTPSTSISNNDCLGITVSSCVKDLAGNALPLRGNFSVAAYGNNTINYNSWNIFYTASTADSTGPQLVHVGPILDATGVRNRIYPFVVFNEPIDAATVISDYFYLTIFGNTTKIGLSLNSDPTLQLITYKPSANLTTVKHVLTVTGAVTDASGNLMAAPQTSNFTVGTVDATKPTVYSVTPTNGSTISRCAPVEVDFSEPMDASSLNGATMTLVQQGTSAVIPVDIQISDNGSHVKMIPESSLYTGVATTSFTATTWGPGSFSGDIVAPLSSKVISGISAADIALLQVGMTIANSRIPVGTTISSIGATSIVMSAQATSLRNSTTVTFTGTNTLTAVSSVSGLVAGMTLSGTGIPGGTTISSVGTTTVTMSAVATAKNTVTVTSSGCGTSSLKCKYVPTILGGASSGVKDRAGNYMNSTDTSVTFTAAADATAPCSGTTCYVAPAPGTVAQNTSFAVFFNEPMDRSTLTNTTLMFPSGTLCPTGFVSVFPSDDGKWAIVNCYHNLAATTAALRITTGAEDRHVNTDGGNCESGAGNAVGANKDFTYTIGASDTTAPTVSSVSPTDRSTSVSTAVAPSVTFNDGIDPRTVIPTSLFLMDQQGNIVNTTNSFNATATTVTLTPVQPLSNPGIYYIVGTTALRDLSGNAYNGLGGETTPIAGVLRTCFSTSAAACP